MRRVLSALLLLVMIGLPQGLAYASTDVLRGVSCQSMWSFGGATYTNTSALTDANDATYGRFSVANSAAAGGDIWRCGVPAAYSKAGTWRLRLKLQVSDPALGTTVTVNGGIYVLSYATGNRTADATFTVSQPVQSVEVRVGKATTGWTAAVDVFYVELYPPPDTPGPVANLTASSAPGYVILDWDSAVGQVNGYRVYRDGELLADIGAEYTWLEDGTALPGMQYWYEVAAYNVDGEGPRVGVYGVADPPPPPATAPENFEALAEPGRVVLTWIASENVDDYVLFRNGVFLAAVVDTTYVDYDVIPGETYTYELQATGLGGNSPWVSVSVTAASLPSPPPAPAGLRADATATRVTLRWQSVVGADGYVVYRVRNGHFPPERLAAQASTVYVDADVAPGDRIGYMVMAYNVAGEGAGAAVMVDVPQPPPLSFEWRPQGWGQAVTTVARDMGPLWLGGVGLSVAAAVLRWALALGRRW